MKTDWERSSPVIIPDRQTIIKMLKPYIRDRQISKVEQIGGGLSNSNVKISLSSGEDVVLRIYNSGGIKGHIEKAILQHVKNIIPVPRVLYHDFSLSHLEYPFLLLSWVNGYQLSDLFMTENKASLSYAGHEVGRYLAKIHDIRFSSPGFFNENLTLQEFDLSGSDSFLNILDDIIKDGPAVDNLGAEMVSNIRQFAMEQAHILNSIGKQNCLVHSDFNPLNILVEKFGSSIQVTGILDWEFSFSNSPLIDIGNMLRYEEITESSFIRPFILSYVNHGGELPRKWLQIAKLLDVIALCDLADQEGCDEARVLDLQSLLRKTINEWDLYDEVQKNIY
ncbi:phosphotransferase family protein [Halobacillus litoralis]|uniref:phosphotransferase family protein n=1 Tax=Halobacillus litoralis TaxID=45668 RepID=UPI0024932C3B|nr:aminoglycoside phosphotransferase family protein [Halobacillus litoralis]